MLGYLKDLYEETHAYMSGSNLRTSGNRYVPRLAESYGMPSLNLDGLGEKKITISFSSIYFKFSGNNPNQQDEIQIHYSVSPGRRDELVEKYGRDIPKIIGEFILMRFNKYEAMDRVKGAHTLFDVQINTNVSPAQGHTRCTLYFSPILRTASINILDREVVQF